MERGEFETNAVFHHLVLEGTSYECGLQMGRYFLEHDKGMSGMLTAPRQDGEELTEETLGEFLALNDRYCPGVGDEFRGLADTLGASLQRVVSNAFWYSRSGCCSHIAALPGATDDGHVLAARSYEWSREDALCLVTTRAAGKYAHIGFSIFACGRLDGMNEKGLCVTMSAGSPGKQPVAGGFQFWAGIRAALDTCATVDEALALLQGMPSCSYDNLILSDRGGHAALMEDACGHRAVRRIGPDSAEHSLFSTNHFALPGMPEHGDAPMWMSLVRSRRIAQWLHEHPGSVSQGALKELLTAPVPAGLSCHYYSDWFGTLWAMLFDITAGTVEICFGSPRANGWHTFSLDTPAGVTAWPALLPDEQCVDTGFFARQPLGPVG